MKAEKVLRGLFHGVLWMQLLVHGCFIFGIGLLLAWKFLLCLNFMFVTFYLMDEKHRDYVYN